MDDLIYCGLPSNIHQSFETLLELLTQLGLTINPKKLVAPCTSLVCMKPGPCLSLQISLTVSLPCVVNGKPKILFKKTITVIVGFPIVCIKMCKTCTYIYTFLRQFNGVVYYDIKPVQTELHLDASLTGMGGIFDNQCYALPIPKNFQYYSIVHLEMINILVALKVWVKCDNMAVVEVLTSGKTKDRVLGTCARNI